MTGIEIFYLVFVLIFLSLWALKLISILTMANFYGRIVSWASLIFIIISYGMLFMIVMSAQSVFISQTFRYISIMFITSFVFQFFEQVLFITKKYKRFERGQPVPTTLADESWWKA